MIIKTHKIPGPGGTTVQILKDEGGDPECPWGTRCVDHDSHTIYKTQKEAEKFLEHPEYWCSGCPTEERVTFLQGGMDPEDFE